MNRQQVYDEIQATLGVLPGFLKQLPDTTLELEWKLLVRSQMDPGPIPNKYRELIGLGIAATTKCRYCVYFHTEMAKLNGASDAEIEDAIHYAKSSAGWSAYLNGSQIEYDEFTREIDQAVAYVREQMSATA